MQFPSALEGVKKLYKAEIIALISGIMAVVAALMAIVSAVALLGGGGAAGLLGSGVLLIVVAVLGIIAFIMNLVGLNKAKPDENNFRYALYAVYVGIIASVVVGFARSDGFLSSMGQTISNICSFLTTFFVCTAIIHLAERLGDGVMREKGLRARSLLMIVYILGIVLGVLGTVFQSTESAGIGVAAAVIMLVAAVLDVVAYLLYLGLLKKARKMLEA